jgi:two-component system sensor histidine kinase YesM
VLVLEVRDDGMGMRDPGVRGRPEPRPEPRGEPATGDSQRIPRSPRGPESLHRIGIGIVNVERRIALNFGSPYGLEIESEPGAFTLVRYVMPALAQVERPGEATGV